MQACGLRSRRTVSDGRDVYAHANSMNEDAFREVFDAEHHEMLRLAWLLLGDESSAQDVVQEAFAKLFVKWRKVDNPGGYVRTVVINGCRDAWRKNKRELEYKRALPRNPADHQPEYLLDAIAALPPKRREIVVLRFYAGMTLKEIARTQGIAEGTVHSALARSLKQLRRDLT